MASCAVCGGVNFEKHAGFLYCSECQTQSQDYHEEEYEFRQHDSALRSAKGSKSRSVKGDLDELSGTWTSWEFFNYILHGMTQELKPICKKKEFETTVLKLWACYLNRLEAAFTSTQNEDAIPKLNINFKERDAKIIYNVAAKSISSSIKKRKKLVKKRARSVSNMSQSSAGTVESKRSRSRKKMKIVSKEYEESMSRLSGETSTLANETIESLGRSSSDEFSYMSDEETKLSKRAKRQVLTKAARDYYNKCENPETSSNRPDYSNCLSKSKLLAIIHLALLIIESDIQLSDLLRFIREGHLSFAKATHFFPKDFKIPRNKESFLYLTEFDKKMPCHYFQRGFVIRMAKFLNFERLPHPNVETLIARYCKELKLPDQVTIYSIRVVRLFFNNYKRKILTYVKGHYMNNFEAMAMGCIIIVLKFYFGLDDKIEMILSGFAKTVNGLKDGANNLFVFEDWKKYMECRNTIIKDFHYPTQERFDSDHYDSRKFIDMLLKESKDEFIADRFTGSFFSKPELVKGVQDITSSLGDTKLTPDINFPPSLTPQESYIKVIKEKVANKELNFSTAAGYAGEYETNDLPWNVLNMKFKDCDITFTRKPQDSIKLLEENNFKVVELSKCDILSNRKIDINQYMSNNEVIFVIVDGSYWVYEYQDFWNTKNYEVFKDEMFDKFSYNFQWLLLECARIIENNVRDLYMEIYRIEKRLLKTQKSNINILKT